PWSGIAAQVRKDRRAPGVRVRRRAVRRADPGRRNLPRAVVRNGARLAALTAAVLVAASAATATAGAATRYSLAGGCYALRGARRGGTRVALRLHGDEALRGLPRGPARRHRHPEPGEHAVRHGEGPARGPHALDDVRVPRRRVPLRTSVAPVRHPVRAARLQ